MLTGEALLLIPSIQIVEGKCRHRIKCESDLSDYYEYLENHPYELCKLFREENVKSIFIEDIDSFVLFGNNLQLISKLTEATFLPFQVYANFQTIDECRLLLDSGIQRVVLSDVSKFDSGDISLLIDNYSSARISFYLPLRNGQINFNHTGKTYDIDCYMRQVKELGGIRIIVDTDIVNVPDLLNQSEIIQKLSLSFSSWSLSYDVRSYNELKQIEELKKYNLDSVIMGKSFYDTSFPCQNIWRLAEQKINELD